MQPLIKVAVLFFVAAVVFNTVALFKEYLPLRPRGCVDGRRGIQGNAVTGNLFVGNVTRLLPENIKDALFANISRAVSAPKYTLPDRERNYSCKYWGVVTTIFPPSAAARDIQGLKEWCLVVVTDKGSPQYNLTARNVRVLDANEQTAVFSNAPGLMRLIPWHHFGRKNLGYLYAIMQGAELVWDFDDDNVRKQGAVLNANPDVTLAAMASNCSLFNVYPFLGSSSRAWPRGYPLDAIKKSCTVNLRDNADVGLHVSVLQSMADNEPDVDAIYRLTQRLPMAFNADVTTAVALPPGTFAPYNAQATLVRKSAMFTLLLPVTVHGRVSDIWRSYIAQRMLWLSNQSIAFTPPRVTQYRTAHNYLADMNAEHDLYYKSSKLVEFLHAWQPSDSLTHAAWLELWIALYEREYIEYDDVLLAAAWMQLLLAAAYELPRILLVRPLHIEAPRDICHNDSMPQLTVWLSDLHDGVRADIASMFAHWGSTVILAGHKKKSGPYPEAFAHANVILPLRPLSPVLEAHTTHSQYVSEQQVHDVFEYYKHDTQIANTDAFICSFPASVCEAWLPYNKTVIFLAAHRYALGRCSRSRWERLNRNLKLAATRGHIVAAMSVYDAEYINYFTGLQPVVLSSTSFWYAGDAKYAWRPERDEILVGPLQLQKSPWLSLLNANKTFVFKAVKDLYPTFTLDDIRKHRAVVLLPYAVMSYGITELYALGVPMFVPDVDFITKLGLVVDRTVSSSLYCNDLSIIPDPHPFTRHMYSPESNDTRSTQYWMQFADYYQWPHITQFSSWEDLMSKLQSTDFTQVNKGMVAHNRVRQRVLQCKWRNILSGIRKDCTVPRSYKSALNDLFQVHSLQHD